MIFTTDIDMDFKDRTEACAVVPHVAASMTSRGAHQRHNSGVYLQNIAKNPFTDCAALDYETAEKFGYFKIDFLTNSIYDGVRDKDHLIALMNTDPPWDFLLDRGIVSKLAQIHSHFGVVSWIKPQSVEDLAVVIALLRPAKKHLTYMPRAAIDKEIWITNKESYGYKKSHAIAYAVSIIVQLNLLVEKMGEKIDSEKSVDASAFPT